MFSYSDRKSFLHGLTLPEQCKSSNVFTIHLRISNPPSLSVLIHKNPPPVLTLFKHKQQWCDATGVSWRQINCLSKYGVTGETDSIWRKYRLSENVGRLLK